MIELITTTAMTLGSALLLAYWFRYSCLLILSAQTARDYAGEIAAENQLGFREVQQQLPLCPAAELCALQQALDRDYVVVQYLLRQMHRHESKLQAGLEMDLEMGMLRVHYRLLQVRFLVSRSLSAQAARQALS